MIYYIDAADVEVVKEAASTYPIAGVTMNPTIVKNDLKNKKVPFFELTTQITKLIGEEKEFHIQVVATKAEDMVKEAQALRKNIKGNLYVKIPATTAGYQAMMALKELGIKTTATAIIDVNQALLAANAGASYVAIYVNRVSNISADGDQVVLNTVKAFRQNNLTTKVLGASFKNALQVEKAAVNGAYGVAVGYDVFKASATHPLTDSSVEQFKLDWESVYGEGNKIYQF
ncbi:transaldolase family protein [Enterococcus sp. AZ103]|uniref:transaldolase family protein n=1 Tax=Enterococcus sp. AZ103 TaxID=2774628 RepID=UPI003F29CEC4